MLDISGGHDDETPPALLIGAPAEPDGALAPLVQRLARRRRVVATERSDVASVLDALNVADVDRADVVGVSLGSLTAQRLALDDPDRVRTLALIGSWSRPDRFLRRVLRDWSVAADRARSADELRAHVALWTESRLAWNGTAVDDSLASADKSHDVASLRALRIGLAEGLAAALDRDLAERLPQLTQPTLIIAGEDDRLVPAQLSRALAERIPGSQLVTLCGAGHLAHHDDHDGVGGVLEEFWSRHAVVASASG
jgi:3-oxoadipate enol-lactonase